MWGPAEELGEEKRFNAENAEVAEVAERRDPRTQRGIAVPQGGGLRPGTCMAITGLAEVEDQKAEGDQGGGGAEEF